MGKTPWPPTGGGTSGARVTKRGHSSGKPSPAFAGGSKAFRVARTSHSAGKPFKGIAGGTAGRGQKSTRARVGRASTGR